MANPSDGDPTEPGYLVPGRECGPCIACCQILEIDEPELIKAAGILCPHCTGRGCGVYSTRPDVCRTWYCLWRRIAVMPDFLRPDITGVVFAVDSHDPPRIVFERQYIVARAISDIAAFNTPAVKAAIDMFTDEGSLPVWLSFNGQKRMIYPDEEFALAILNPTSAATQTLSEKAKAWRVKYGLN